MDGDLSTPQLLLATGIAQLQSGHLQSAISLLSKALAGLEYKVDRLQVVGALALLCNAQRMAGMLDDALQSAGTLLRLGEEHDDAFAVAIGLLSSGEVLYRRGRMSKAAEDIARSIQQLRRIPEAKGNLADAQFYLGLILLYKGQLKEARKAFTQAKASYESASIPLGVANSLVQCARVDVMSDLQDGVQQILEEAEKVYQKLGDDRGVANMLMVSGALHKSRRTYDEADRAYEAAAELFHTVGAHSGQATALVERGTLLLNENRLDEALRTLEEAAAISRKANDNGVLGRALEGYGQVRVQQGRTEEALRYFAEAEVLFESVEDLESVRRMCHAREALQGRG